jgi:UDP-N-acetylmuramyl pentapeptide phosphotransferase/UDP-N-acetylglucosamine-1-phosphate transferase
MLLHPSLLVLFSLLLAFFIVFVSIPPIVSVAHLKNLYDIPGKRKSHTLATPNLGGVALFAGLSISSGLFIDISGSPEFLHLLIAMIILFFVGIKDDILIIAPVKKLYGEILATIVLVIAADMRFTSLHGFLGIYQINYISSILLTSFVVIVIINAFNLIDGIDGLASGIGILISFIFGIWFFLVGQTNYAIISAALLGALLGFFGYNVFGRTNKVFMGDTGSLILGLVMSLIVIKFNEFNISYTGVYSIDAAPAVSFGILMLPLFDTLRVFIIRIVNKQSPFDSDKNHLHHRMLKLGLSHFGSTTLLLSLNLVFIIIAFSFQWLGVALLIGLNLFLGLMFTITTEVLIHRIKQRIFTQEQTRHHARA